MWDYLCYSEMWEDSKGKGFRGERYSFTNIG